MHVLVAAATAGKTRSVRHSSHARPEGLAFSRVQAVQVHAVIVCRGMTVDCKNSSGDLHKHEVVE